MFFIDALGVEEITLHISKEVLGKRMDLDENFNELKDEIKLYLETNECFVSDFGLWTVKFKKSKVTDEIYNYVNKKAKALSIGEISKYLKNSKKLMKKRC